MMKRLTLLAASLALVLGILLPVTIATASPFDNSKQAVCQGVALDESTNCDTVTASTKDPNSIIRTALSIFSWIIGVVSVAVMMVAGVKYITSGGDAGKTAQAKDTILYAVVGLVIAILAQVIVQFVIRKVVK